MCNYCDYNLKFKAENKPSVKSNVRIEGYYLVVGTDDTQDFFEISFCPMCGEEL